MSAKTKQLLFGSLKSATAIAIGAVTGLQIADPAVFGVTTWAGLVHTAKVVGWTVLVTELRYGWQWISAWAAKSQAPTS